MSSTEDKKMEQILENSQAVKKLEIIENMDDPIKYKKEVQMFCEDWDIDLLIYRQLHDQIQNHLSKGKQQRWRDAKNKRRKNKQNNFAYYSLVLQNIIEEPDFILQNDLLSQHSFVVQHHLITYGNVTNQILDAKRLLINYSVLCDQYHDKKKNNMVTKSSSLKSFSKREHQQYLQQHLLQVEEKIKNSDYFVEQEMDVIRGEIIYFSNKISSQKLRSYRQRLNSCYQKVCQEVVLSYKADPKYFDILTYYSITNIHPKRLFNINHTLMENRLYRDILSKCIATKTNNSMLILPNELGEKLVTRSMVAEGDSYTYHNMTLSVDEMLNIYDHIDERLPKTTTIFKAVLNEHIKKKKLMLQNTKKLVK